MKLPCQMLQCIVSLLLFLSTLPAAANVDKIYMTGHSHIDLAWKWNYAESIGICHNTFRDVMDLMDHYENDSLPGNPLFYAQSQAQAYEWMETQYPELFERIRSWLDKGQWEPVGGMWAESDTNLVSGESLVRQILYGKLYFLERLGVDVRVGWLPDTFGYSAGLPQIFKKAGIDYFACTKITWNDTHPPQKHMFHWASPDGSQVLTYLSLGSYDDIPLPPVIDEAIEKLNRLQPDIPLMLFYIGVGDHGGGVYRILVDLALELKRRGYPIVFSPSEEFFRDLEVHGVNDVINDELYLEFHRGTYTSRAHAKERNRRAEIGMETLEKVASVSIPYGGLFPQEDRDGIWKKILVNQFHDVLPGSAIDLVYKDFDADHDFIATRTNELLDSNLERLCDNIQTSQERPQGEPLVVFNPLSWTRSGPVALSMTAEEARGIGVVDESGEPLPVQFSPLDQTMIFWAEDIPSIGYKTFFLVPDRTSMNTGGLSSTRTRLENASIAATLDPSTGWLVSLLDKRAGGREVIQPGGGANVLQMYTEGFHPFPAWDLGYNKYTARPRTLNRPVSLDLIEAGPVRAVVQATYRHLGMSFAQRVVVWAAQPRLDFEFQVDDWGKIMSQLLKVVFPLNLVNQSKQATYDVPYAALTRTHDGSVANWEASGQKWVNLQNNGTEEDYGVALLSGNKYGFDIANDGPGEGWSDGKANVLRMTLLKSSSQPLPGALGNSFGGPVTDKGSFTSSYALYPHAGSWEEAGVVHQGYEFNYPLIVHRTDRHEGTLPSSASFLEVSPATVVATVLKEPERPVNKDELILRLFETARRDTEVSIVFPTKKLIEAREVDLLEGDLGKGRAVHLTSSGMSLEIGHDEIVTIRLEYEEKGEPSPQPAPIASEGDHCGCSSLGSTTHEGARTVYGIAFWILMVLIPLLLNKRAHRS